MTRMEIDDHVARRLETDIIVWLTTVRPDGRPSSVPVWFAWDEPTITAYAPTATGKVRNIAAHPEVALALDSHGGTDVVLLHGTAALGPPGEAAAASDERFVAKYGHRMGDQTPESWAATFERRITVTVAHVRAWHAG